MAQQKTKASGTIEWKNGRYYAKVSVPGQTTRKGIRLRTNDGRDLDQRGTDEPLARKLAAALSAQMRSTTHEHIKTELSTRTTVEQFGEMWTSGQLLAQFGEVNGLKVKASANDDRNRLRLSLYPYLKKPVATATEQDVEKAFALAYAAAAGRKGGKGWRQATKLHLYQVSRRLFGLAIRPARLRKDNPVHEGLRPAKDKSKLYSFLYPDELLLLLACEAVPLARRVYYAMGCYTGLRKASLKAFTWAALDFQHNTVMSLVSKTDVAQIFAQSDPMLPGLQSLMVVLARYEQHMGFPTGPIVSYRELRCKKDAEAEVLRADLRAAGITREVLFLKNDKVEPLRFHDLRATFVTWARRAGKGDGWIGDRTGHITAEMMKRYDRGARQLADLQYLPFPDISTAIPELAQPTNVARLRG